MKLYIMRHGEAQHLNGLHNGDDSQRPLTKQGQLEAQMMANWLISMKVNIDTLFVSPFLRAQQTCAGLLATIKQSNSASKMAMNPITLDFITPAGDAKQVHDFLDGCFSEFSNEQTMLMVSHMPLVSYLIAELTNSQNAPIFATAAIAEIEYDVSAMRGELVRIVSPLDLC